MLKKIEIEGLRGFSKKQSLDFAIPNGKEGSGLTTLVGMNNTGKTTIIEAIRYYNCDINNISFSKGKRNIKNENKVYIRYTNTYDKGYTLITKEQGGSQVEITNSNFDINSEETPYVLPSRRHVNYEINGNYYQSNRWDYINNEIYNTKVRKPTIDNFSQRMFNWDLNRDEFNALLYRIIDKSINWYIEQNDNGNYFLAFKNEHGNIHSSEGIGDGIWSIFTLIDALYDAKENSIIVIDEPELSLHPSYQKRVLEVILEASKNKQIIISTHSPYFLSWMSLQNGGKIHRTLKNKDNDILINSLEQEDIDFIISCSKNYYNPHVWGIDAKELFFLDDGMIVVEGQEDVVAFRKICNEMSIKINAEFFGWGAGGASNIEKILKILKHLGYKKICAIYDGDKKDELLKNISEFPEYQFRLLWKDDIRDKPAKCYNFKEGVLDDTFHIKGGSSIGIAKFLESLNDYFD